MALPNIFSQEVSEQMIKRINLLKDVSEPLWGKMSVSQMLAHCCVTYEMTYENKHPKPNILMRVLLKYFVRKAVTNEFPYKQSVPTAPAFLIKAEKDFEKEKARLISYIIKTQNLGGGYFDNRVYPSFGVLKEAEWNNMFYKHLNHHLSQFGV